MLNLINTLDRDWQVSPVRNIVTNFKLAWKIIQIFSSTKLNENMEAQRRGASYEICKELKNS